MPVRLPRRPEPYSSEVPGWDQKAYIKVAKRAHALSEWDMLAYADAAGSGMSQAFTDYAKHSEVASLDELRAGLIQLWAIEEELRLRWEAAKDLIEHTPGG
jgi:hypothetical protein